ncbi:MAG TPA: bifunctional diaminohydroxyphosphoribosylaminopyrimidine deaminase/5-amino-6-(5-phosphoribosylamino)uracil reductase RibD [Spirochaetota bacterium]|nr:bifunctional diaminohydroxyphosphoribosylaminopyrimidine deaminase/5-amino-6-(5-phosphoribosylamino)uracil reductase RibD [Spirochaetota bacterium]HPI88144.1 bifunctional diaminohydroxyphosphoribosylaminopyrimidine deaminase/5-amino-6-(5-phosphoribosylamino)uracil reductase RibD [Spirochaetota bacterium]HPR47919.1 bifunctional diaminohydroxyphosphoribosylaminopyrimidine deaminase/5-amino-6-(5-phosphoribosylamino)uracil reductase RibD [Spirochaetota bacterium]
MKTGEIMHRALGIAFDRMGTTSPNPAVGAVIVKEGRVIASGGTCPYGSSHAEIMAINAAREDLGGAEMYVTLEPCNHYGKTPPCTEAIIKSGITRVYLPILDPNPLVAGKGVKRLKEAGVDVIIMNEFAPAAADLIRPFKKNILRKTPFILHKSAITLDGRIATEKGDSRWISSPSSRFIVHKLRAKVDAVIIGKNTVAADNPSLTVRFDDFDDAARKIVTDPEAAIQGRKNFFIRSLLEREIETCRQPLRVLAGIPDSLDSSASFLSDDNYVVFEKKSRLETMRERDEKKFLSKLNLVAIEPDDQVGYIKSLLRWLSEKGIMFAMLEGGGKLAGSFLDAGEIDQFTYFIAPRIAGKGIPSIAGAGSDFMADTLMVRDVSTVMIGDDIFFNGYREAYNFEMM